MKTYHLKSFMKKSWWTKISKLLIAKVGMKRQYGMRCRVRFTSEINVFGGWLCYLGQWWRLIYNNLKNEWISAFLDRVDEGREDNLSHPSLLSSHSSSAGAVVIIMFWIESYLVLWSSKQSLILRLTKIWRLIKLHHFTYNTTKKLPCLWRPFTSVIHLKHALLIESSWKQIIGKNLWLNIFDEIPTDYVTDYLQILLLVRR